MANDSVMIPGTVVGSRYEIRELLGRGGFSITYLAIDKQLLDHPCVVKELLLSHQTNDLAITLFKREAEVLLKLDHPRIPKVHACFPEHDRLFLVQDFVGGETLESKLDRESRLPEARVRDIVLQLLDVLEYLHSHKPVVIHRDIKPANVMERPDGSIVLIDFGAVRETLGGSDTAGQTAISSAGYSPAEQYIGRASPASDIYALGATALHLVSGTHPRDWHESTTGGFDFGDKLPCSPQFAAVIERMVADLPHRFQSAHNVRAAMQGDSTTVAIASGNAIALAPTRDQTKLASSAPVAVVPAAPGRGLVERLWPPVVGVAVVVLVLVALFKPDGKFAEPTAGASAAQVVVGPPPPGLVPPPSSDSPSADSPSSTPPTTPNQLPPQDTVREPPNVSSSPAQNEAPRTNEATKTPPPAPVEAAKPVTPPGPRVVVPSPCASTPQCFNAGHFAATLAYVAVSQRNSSSVVQRNVKLTMTIQNLMDQPLILAYRAGSGQLIDDEKHPYVNESRMGESYVKGIGMSTGRDANPEFVLDPQESRQIVLDNYMSLSRTEIFGVTYTYDFTIDELVVQSDRARVVRSSAVTFRDIKEPSRGRDENETAALTSAETFNAREFGTETHGPSAGSEESSAERVIYSATGGITRSPQQDPCGTTPNCYSAGRFTATVIRIWGRQIRSANSTSHFVKLTLQIRNVSDKRIALSYKAESGALTDDTGHRYRNDNDGGKGFIRGIGLSNDASDPPLVLAPGEARDATFDNRLSLDRSDVAGTVYSYDLALQELELLPARQTRVTRTNAIAFHDLRESARSRAQGPDTTVYRGGRFEASVKNVSSVDVQLATRRERIVTITLRITNLTDQGIILAYRAVSGQLSDERGHSFRSDQHGGAAYISGIGLSTRDNIDATFTLAPGESRDASFKNYISVETADRLGSSFDYDLVLDECERLPSRQVRVVHSHSVSFHDFQNSLVSTKQRLIDLLKPVVTRRP